VKKDLITKWQSESVDIVSMKIQTFQKPIIISACYRTNENTLFIEALLTYAKSPIWIGEDFNLPDIEWETSSIVGSQNSKNIE